MKKQTLLLLTLLTVFYLNTFGQVTLEHVYFTGHCRLWVTDIGNNNYKYVRFCENSPIVDLYNLDHTLYLSFTTPDTIWAPPHYREVQYVTNSLFDCDSTTLEYVLTNGAAINGFYVYRTDGTLIFGQDSVVGPYCIGCGDGDYDIRPIYNTPEGTKLMLFKSNSSLTDSTWIYSLCGTLPLVIDEKSITASYVKVFPNPTSGTINFEITPPSNTEKFKLTIYDSSFQVVDEKNITDGNYRLDLKQRSLSGGTYLFDLRTDRKVFQTGKFVIAK